MEVQHMQIGEVAHRTGLSLRTIRYYEEMGLVIPSARSAGGFRLYTDADIARLQLIKRMKPLEFSLEETKDLLDTLDTLGTADDAEERKTLVGRLETYHQAAEARVVSVREQLAIAEGFAAEIRREIADHRSGTNR